MTQALAMHQNNSRRDPAGTRHRILTAAIEEFRSGGLAGARVDSIARRAQTNERMLYYYFGNKEQLFVAVVEDVYQKFADAQAGMDLSHEAPELAMRRFVRFIWEYCYLHPEVVRVINNENLQEGVHLRSSGARNAMRPVIVALTSLLERGIATGAFRQQVDPLHFYLAISGLGYYLVSNRFTLHAAFARDPADPSEREHLLTLHLDMLLAFLRCDDAAMPSRGIDGACFQGGVGASGNASERQTRDEATRAMASLHDPRTQAGASSGLETASLRTPLASFFPGVARAPDMTKGGGAPARRSESEPSVVQDATRDAKVHQTRLDVIREAGAAYGSSAGAPEENVRTSLALPSVSGVDSGAIGPGLAPAAVPGDTAAEARTAVFWPKSRFPSL